MELVIINSGQNKLLKECLNSLIETMKTNEFDIHIVGERESRESTLNFVFKKYANQDILVFGDDIIFTSNWYDFLIENENQADIIGFSMLYPGTDKIQDTGYDLVSIDNQISLKPRNRGSHANED